MGKSNVSNKEKRQAMKAERLAVAAAQKLVSEAQKVENPLLPFTAFTKFNKNGLDLIIEYKKSSDLDEKTKSWVWELETKNMKQAYEECDIGWNPKDKQEEMIDDRAWYLIAKHVSSDNPVAFSHFRFDVDFAEPVLYCYELQLEKEVQRKGLGKFMMQVLELMAFKNNMSKVVLTTFKHNPDGLNFFYSLNYSIDETSPEDDEGKSDDFCYFILSKKNPRLNKMPEQTKAS
uniref:N-alpha-acetyltransferase 40 n=1 Tax=Cacopsylla melanoneura TaxID=428564 RepID=A0A8D9A2G0_9HEMI